MLQLRTEIVFNHIPGIERALPRDVAAVVGKVVADGERIAKANIVSMRAIDTGNMLNNVTHEHQGGARDGTVSSQAEYSAFVNFGTYKMSARPFFTNMSEELRVTFPKAIEALLKGLR